MSKDNKPRGLHPEMKLGNTLPTSSKSKSKSKPNGPHLGII